MVDDPTKLNSRDVARRDVGRGDATSISPRMTALFGAIFGLATMASVFALLIQVFPVTPTAEQAPSEPSSSASTNVAGEREIAGQRPQRKLLPGPWRVSALKSSHQVVTGTMNRRSFIKALAESGVPKGEIYRILKAMEGVRKFDRTGKDDLFTVALARGTNKVAAFEYQVDPTAVYQARTNENGLLRGTKLDMKVRSEEFAASFYVGNDLVKSYRAGGLESGLIKIINKAFNGQTSTEAFEEGGVVKVIMVETTALGAFVRYDGLRALEYRPPDPAKEPLRAYWFEGESSSGYVDERGRRPSARGWRSPVPGAPITSHFNPKRMHPVLKRVMPHNGTDFGAASGTPVYAALRGSVEYVGMRGASGNLVTIRHPNGVQTGYAHLLRFAKGLKRGQKVGTRQLIGYVGSTGRSTGPHLHFSAKRNGKFFDPLTLKLDALTLLPVSERTRFLKQKAELDAQLQRIPLPEPPEPEPEPEPPAVPESSETPDANSHTPAPTTLSSASASESSSDPSEDLLGEDLSGDIE